ncbi:MAG: diacylglycerol kinase family protein [Candidatus Shapirobacteria bacterium]|nr:diacylglycerol kinase family protein [Candidatus Shapirobacteria bacterium]
MKRGNSLVRSVICALNGIYQTVREERNIKIELIIGAIIIAAGAVLTISPFEWLVIILIIGAVLSLEVKNSSTEKICDLLNQSLNLDPQLTKDPRDMAAGAVLILAISSIFIGLIIFLPKIT